MNSIRKYTPALFLISFIASASLHMPWAAAQSGGNPESAGHGWPIPVDLARYDGYPEEQFVGSVTPWYWDIQPTATAGAAPEGVTPLDRDLFTSDDFYRDKALWMDPRY